MQLSRWWSRLNPILLVSLVLLGSCSTDQKAASIPPEASRAKPAPKAIASKSFELSFQGYPGQAGGLLILLNKSGKKLRVSEMDPPVCLKLLAPNGDIKKLALGQLMETRFDEVPNNGVIKQAIEFNTFADASSASGRYWVRILYDDDYANSYYASDAPFLSQVGQVTTDAFLIEVVGGYCVIAAPN